MNTRIKKLASVFVAAAMAVTTLGLSAPAVSNVYAGTSKVTGLDTSKAKVSVDWNERYTYAELQQQFKDLNKAYPEFSELTSIGKTYEGRDIMCMEITDESVANDTKTKITVFGNIHGGERESGSCAMYSAWYLLENSDCADIAATLDKYVVYVIPVINPDGYEQSFVTKTRENMDPVDHDGDGIPFNDPLADINGDGFIGTVYALNPETGKTAGTLGNESKDSNHDGILANDVRNSGVDLNRNFDFLWGQDGRMDTEGPSAASELETQAIQNFIDSHSDMAALTTLHTGIQCVLYPWGYRAPDESNAEEVADIQFMQDTSADMAKAIKRGTHRNFYAKQSYYDYQTYSELIDYAYGLYGIHSYTIEVYSQGSSSSSAYNKNLDPLVATESQCMWNDTIPATKVKDYTHAQAETLFEIAGMDMSTLLVREGSSRTGYTYRPLAETEGIRIQTSGTNQMVNRAPDDQDEMVTGVMDGILKMIESEAPGMLPISSVSLDKTSFICDGKVKAPKVTVMYKNQVLTEGEDYELSGDFQSKKPGTHKFTVKGIGKYTGSFDRSFKITVKGTTIKSLKKGKKAFTVKVAKQSSAYVSGYQVRYSLKSSMAGAKTKTIGTKASAVSKKVKNLKGGKKYYVQVRTYKTVNGTKYTSKWSAKKTVKTKK